MNQKTKDLIRKIKGVSLEDDGEFKAIISTLIDDGFFAERDLSHAFSVSLPTVRRWKEGRSSPYPATRKYLYAWMLKRLDPRGETLI